MYIYIYTHIHIYIQYTYGTLQITSEVGGVWFGTLLEFARARTVFYGHQFTGTCRR